MPVSFFEAPKRVGIGSAYERKGRSEEARLALTTIMQDATEARDGIFSPDIEIAIKACSRIFELQEEADLLVQEYKADNQVDGLPVSFHPCFDGKQAEWSVDGTLLSVGTYNISTGSFTCEVLSWNGINTISLHQLAS